LLFVFALSAFAQTPAFDAASIKPNTSGGGPSSIHLTAGRVAMQNVSLRKVMLNAYGIPEDREYAIEGPDWLTTEHFDIDATFPADAPAPQVRVMLQSLLADRFNLTLHKEPRQLPMYSLVVARGGVKIHSSTSDASRTSAKPGHFEATGITMQKLADLMARQAGLPVADATGAAGVYDFTLDWSPAADLKLAAGEEGAAGGDQGPSFFTAIQEQLGLRLESGKGPVEVLVLDRMEKVPTAN
jgi:uncharacterized protein (TIGR03435 family)